jgi:hypothetical protein
MPLSMRQLELLRKKVDAEDVAIDFESMSLMTAQEAMQYFVNGGKMPDPDAPPPIRVQRMQQTQVIEVDHSGDTKGVPSDVEDEVEEDEDKTAGAAYAIKHGTFFAAPRPEDMQSEEEREWRRKYEKRVTGQDKAAAKGTQRLQYNKSDGSVWSDGDSDSAASDDSDGTDKSLAAQIRRQQRAARRAA